MHSLWNSILTTLFYQKLSFNVTPESNARQVRNLHWLCIILYVLVFHWLAKLSLIKSSNWLLYFQWDFNIFSLFKPRKSKGRSTIFTHLFLPSISAHHSFSLWQSTEVRHSLSLNSSGRQKLKTQSKCKICFRFLTVSFWLLQWAFPICFLTQ